MDAKEEQIQENSKIIPIKNQTINNSNENVTSDSIESLNKTISRLEIKIQTVILSSEFSQALFRKKNKKIEELRENYSEDQLHFQEIEKFLEDMQKENEKLQNDFQNLKEKYNLEKDEFYNLQNSIKESDENVVTTAENYINSQQILADLRETIDEMIPQKEKLRQDIRTCFTGQAPLKTEKEQIQLQIRNIEKVLNTLQGEKSDVESKLTQHKSQLRGNKLGLTTDETGRRAAAMRLQQAKTELGTVENRLAETISLAHEQSGLSQKFQTEIKEMEEEKKTLISEIHKYQDIKESLEKDNKKYEEIVHSLETKIEQINKEQAIKLEKLKKKQKETEEMIQIGELRKQQVNTYFESLQEKKIKLENEVLHYETEIKHVRERNAELHKRYLIMKKRQPKPKTPNPAHFSRSKLFPSI